jgi:hypothetical protein
MPVIMPLKWCVVLTVLMVVSASLWAGPIGFGVNSRGNEVNSQLVNALWRINLSSGEVDYVGWTSFLDLEALALHPDGTLHGADDESKTMVRVSKVSGLAQPIGGSGNRHNMGVSLTRSLDFGMAYDCDGTAFVVSDVAQTLFLANMETGRLTAIASEGSLRAPITDIAIRGSRAYGIGVGSPGANAPAAPNLYRVNLENATSELIGPLGPQASPYNNAGLAFDESGVLWAITDRRAVSGGDFPSEILRIDTDSGQAVKVAETIVGVESLAIAPPGGCTLGGDDGDGGDPADPTDGVAVPAHSLPGLVLLLMLVFGVGVMRIRVTGS